MILKFAFIYSICENKYIFNLKNYKYFPMPNYSETNAQLTMPCIIIFCEVIAVF